VRLSFVCFILLLSSCCVPAQSPNGSIRGVVFDPDAKVIASAEVIVVNDATGVKYVTSTNSEGIYAVENLPPGPYRIQVSKFGFKGIIKPDIVLNVQDVATLNFTLPIGASSVTVTVEGGAPMLNTTNGSVSTVVDRQFVANMPLNGRSFQDLILLTPGVLTISPQSGGYLGQTGEFSVNGQRTESNYYTVDGVSASGGMYVGAAAPQTAGIAGSLPLQTSLGTSQALTSVDALQEFRVESSTYSAEFGRSPGGQFSFVTRSGTNQWHGSAFNYLRNSVFDANDWFSNYYGQSQAALRQNDFGGTLGGPIDIPKVYRGKDKSFFFLSYEGLRVVQPQAATVSYVPTVALRQSAPPALRSILDAFPIPNCAGPSSNCTNDLGNGLGDFIGTWSNPATLDSYSVRLDHSLKQKLKLSFRFSDTPSNVAARSGGNYVVPSVKTSTSLEVRTYTIGATSVISSRANEEFRLNLSTSRGSQLSDVTSGFGGGKPVDLWQSQGLSAATFPNAFLQFCLAFSSYVPCLNLGDLFARQKQWNVVDNFAYSVGRHQWKFGADYRRLTPQYSSSTPTTVYEYFSAAAVQANSVDYGQGQSYAAAYPLYRNFSGFAQDDWRVSARLNLSLGLRWEVNPAPTATKGGVPFSVRGDIDTPSSLALAPQGTALWQTGWHNFAPRVGGAYVARRDLGYETVLRGGFGVFYDTGQQLGSWGYLGPGFTATAYFGNLNGAPATFPVPVSQAAPAIVVPPQPPYGLLYAFPSDLQLPYTLQWNASVQQAIGKAQTLTVSYVGANGRRLLEQSTKNLSSSNANFTFGEFFQNGLTSDYNALQVQLQRRMSHGLQALASYTWSHSIDYGSFNADLPYQRGDSDFDVRHNLSMALSYELPKFATSKFLATVAGHWALDGRFTARSGFPVTLKGGFVTDPATGQFFFGGLNRVQGQPLYVYGSQYPGGRAINAAAFSLPPANEFGDAARNIARGFGASQFDIAVRKEFPIREWLKLQFRAEAFNILNHPNFGLVNSSFGSSLFGQATASLGQSLGILSPLYQMGGPRSMQFAVKLIF
jgi:hypothetical protein